jgi:hypothetical protein
MKSVTFEVLEYVFYIPGAIKCTYSVSNPGPVTKRWYTKQDFSDFRNQGKLISLELRMSGCSRLLETTLFEMLDEEKSRQQKRWLQWIRYGYQRCYCMAVYLGVWNDGSIPKTTYSERAKDVR